MTALEPYIESRFQWDTQAIELASRWVEWAAAYALAVSQQNDGRIVLLTQQIDGLRLRARELVENLPELGT